MGAGQEGTVHENLDGSLLDAYDQSQYAEFRLMFCGVLWIVEGRRLMVLLRWCAVVLAIVVLGGCYCYDRQNIGAGFSRQTKCLMGCLDGNKCWCTPNCPCHQKGCTGSCRTCEK